MLRAFIRNISVVIVGDDGVGVGGWAGGAHLFCSAFITLKSQWEHKLLKHHTVIHVLTISQS